LCSAHDDLRGTNTHRHQHHKQHTAAQSQQCISDAPAAEVEAVSCPAGSDACDDHLIDRNKHQLDLQQQQRRSVKSPDHQQDKFYHKQEAASCTTYEEADEAHDDEAQGCANCDFVELCTTRRQRNQ